ncbi:MAG: norR 20 [Anaerosporomusa subterranea]|nr:norR 20 [Anaerosporomusa subterranea]
MAEIAFIIPSREICAVLEDLLIGSEDIEVVYARLEEGVMAARKAVLGGARVLVSRGLTYRLIAERLSDVSVIEIPFSGYDLLRAYQETVKLSTQAAVVESLTVLEGMASIEAILSAPDAIIKVNIDDYPEYASAVAMAIDLQADCVIGNQAVVFEAERRGVKGVLLRSGHEALQIALEAARQMLALHGIRDANARQTDVIINTVDSGVLALDARGELTAVNSEARRLLNIDGDAAGEWVERMRQYLKLGEKLTGKIERIGSMELVVNYLPIVAGGSVVGIVATLQELRRLQDIEHKTRQEMSSRGRVAKYTFLDIETRSSEMQRALEEAKRFACFDSTVLIQGETGVGKEYFAHAIHQAGTRRKGPFVVVNCAAIPENILESELFGYSEGAFTGAKKGGKMGLFEQAHGGTIFLDEIGEMSELLQARLLRVLQEHEVYRLGDDRIIPVNIRVIAATNRDLQQMVRERRFREDLYYRLDVLTLDIPPLRERTEDIAYFVRNFIREFSSQYRTVVDRIEPQAMELLTGYDWPGNIRELHNVVGRLTALSLGKSITTQDVLRVLAKRMDLSAPPPATRSLKGAEDEAIREALAKTNGNKQKAAEILGIGRVTLWRRLKELEGQQ